MIRLAGIALHLALLAGLAAAVGGTTALVDPVLAATAALLGLWSWSESGAATRRTPRRAPGWLPLGVGLALAAVVVAGVAHRAQAPSDLGLPHLAGAALLVGGSRLRAHTARHLGAWFLDDIALHPGHRLVTDGPYRWVRHPSEAGTLLIAAGVVALTGSLAALCLAACALLPLVHLRVRREDRLLSELPGWASWAAQTPALLPFRAALVNRRGVAST